MIFHVRKGKLVHINAADVGVVPVLEMPEFPAVNELISSVMLYSSIYFFYLL